MSVDDEKKPYQLMHIALTQTVVVISKSKTHPECDHGAANHPQLSPLSEYLLCTPASLSQYPSYSC
jgi:hypothetical protein